MTWHDGVTWASGLGQYAIFTELAVFGALWLIGVVSQQLFGKKGSASEADDAD